MMDATRAGPDYDVVIAGGGMIGTSLALALSTLKLRIAVVEAVARRDADQPSFDDRSTALSRSSQRTYTALGLWDDIVAAASPIERIHVSDKGRFGFAHIDAAEQGVEALGYVVINRVLGEVLQRALDGRSNVDVLCPARVSGVRSGRERLDVEVSASAGCSLSCRLLVAADGARSIVRDIIGIAARHVDYGQRAVIGNLLTERPIGKRAFERFTEHGPIAMLPLPGGRAAFVWIVDAARADELLALDDDLFAARLQQSFGQRLGEFSRVGARATYPLWLSRADRLVAPRAALVGNAAHGLHPVAAQGFNLGLRDVAALADCIADAIAFDDGDPGAQELLDRYATWRRADQNKLVTFTDGLVRLFGSRRPPLRVLRNVGMLGFDFVPGVRKLFARHTMGLAGRLPRLSRGVPLS
ncbi:MAG: 2-octaprenyl-6-methoxyphenyl hydroxylase [Woeseiaceae bacterium]|nr:2-octaprenyl-6-methoxyphenyl hydroxylase [Woeseiaceae bacterium]